MDEHEKMSPGTDEGGEGGTSGNWGGGASHGTSQKGVPTSKGDKREEPSQIPAEDPEIDLGAGKREKKMYDQDE